MFKEFVEERIEGDGATLFVRRWARWCAATRPFTWLSTNICYVARCGTDTCALLSNHLP